MNYLSCNEEYLFPVRVIKENEEISFSYSISYVQFGKYRVINLLSIKSMKFFTFLLIKTNNK